MRWQFMRDRQEIEVYARQSLTEFIVNFPGDPHPLLLADALKFAGQRVQLAQRAFMLGAGVPACVDDRRQEGGRQPGDPTGVAYKRLGLPNEDRFVGADVCYGAGASEAVLCGMEPVSSSEAGIRPPRLRFTLPSTPGA